MIYKVLITCVALYLPLSLKADLKFKKILDKYCLECHGGRKTKGGVSFKEYQDINHIYDNHEIWKDAITQVEEGEMPPEDDPQMTIEEKQYFLGKLNKVFDEAEKIEFSDPGPSPLRRLTKKEYNNTIRDIFGKDLNLGKEFPSEGGGGEGFDNNAEVMNFSPLMFEKYVQEAVKLSKHLTFSYVTGFNISDKEIPLRNEPQMVIKLQRENDEIRNSVYPPQFQVEKYLRDYMFAARELVITNKADDKNIWNHSSRKKMNPVFVKHMIEYLDNKKNKNEVEKRFLSKWFALDKSSNDKAVNAAGKQFLDGYKKSRYINEHTTPESKEFYRELVNNVRRKVFKLSKDELLACLSEADRKRLPQLKHELDISSDWNEREIQKLLTKRFEKFDKDKKSQALKQPEKFLDNKDNAKLNKLKENIVWQNSEKTKLAKLHIKELATKAFRRPATETEVTKVFELFRKEQASKGSQAAARMVLVRIFCSPAFIFRIEKQKFNQESYRISNHELAVRLSYFLWSSMPDKELLDAAKRGDLYKKGILNKQIDRMLKDPKARSLAEDFAAQWLKFKEIKETVDLDKKRFPEFTHELAEDMFQECVQTLNYIIQSDTSVLQVIDNNYVFANSRIAPLYGLKDVKSEKFQKIQLKNSPRGGIVTSPAIMAMTSYPLRTSPVLRGNWIISSLLGTPTPPPPENIEELPEDDKVADGLTVKQRFEKHREDPTCYSCHSRLDPMGFPLELYDPLGRYRSESGGHAIDATGKLKNGNIINGPDGLKKYLLSKKDLFLENLASKALGYALGRSLEFFDRYTLKQAVTALEKNDYKFSALVKSIVHSRLFQYRRGHIQASK
ncbi:MAG: DUF1592 domain-containing protein [Lentisphaerales bacterium]|nr:DUF1592 domain-containing protein [Lentisphaerales bacterium]